jgi:hypothetical protein
METNSQDPLPLFRQEALEHATQRSFLSHVILTTPIQLWTSTMILIGFTALGLGLSTMIEIPRNTELSGQIEPLPKTTGKVFAQLWADANTVNTFHPGQNVHLKYDAFSFTTYGVFEGRVKAIASQPIMTKDPQSKSIISFYPIAVELKQQHIPTKSKRFSLRPGMTLTATVVLERKTLFNWVLEPPIGGRNNG